MSTDTTSSRMVIVIAKIVGNYSREYINAKKANPKFDVTLLDAGTGQCTLQGLFNCRANPRDVDSHGFEENRDMGFFGLGEQYGYLVSANEFSATGWESVYVLGQTWGDLWQGDINTGIVIIIL